MKLYKRIRVQVPIREKRAIESNGGRGHEWVTTGYRDAIVDIEISELEVDQIAFKAACNKSKKSRQGPIYCKAYFPK